MAGNLEPDGSTVSVTVKTSKHTISETLTGDESDFIVPLPNSVKLQGRVQITLQNESQMEDYKVTGIDVVSPSLTTLIHRRTNWLMGPTPWIFILTSDGESLWENPDLVVPAWVSQTKPDRQVTVNRGADQIQLIHAGINESVWRVTTKESNTWFTVSQMYDDGWHATDNGASSRVIRSDGVLTSLQSQRAGVHTVVLSYRPRGFILGVLGGVCGTVTLIFVTSVWLYRRKRKNTPKC